MTVCSAGHSNPEGNRFCQVCGLLLEASSSTEAGQAASPQDASSLSSPAAGSPNSKRWIAPVAIVGVIGVAAVGFLLLNREPASEVLTVRLLVFDDFSGCDLGLGYIDVGGSNVIVEADGEIVATGELPNFGDEDSLACVFETTLFDVPSDKSSYELTIGRRGTQDSSRVELEESDWVWEATLGL